MQSLIDTNGLDTVIVPRTYIRLAPIVARKIASQKVQPLRAHINYRVVARLTEQQIRRLALFRTRNSTRPSRNRVSIGNPKSIHH